MRTNKARTQAAARTGGNCVTTLQRSEFDARKYPPAYDVSCRQSEGGDGSLQRILFHECLIIKAEIYNLMMVSILELLQPFWYNNNTP